MAGKGRPVVEDKRDNQYRVLMNDEEDTMLAYCSRVTGMPKSQIFRKGIEVLYQQIQLNPGEAKTIDIDLPRSRFEGWDVKTNTMRVVPGKYEVMVGNSSADKDLKRILVNIK